MDQVQRLHKNQLTENAKFIKDETVSTLSKNLAQERTILKAHRPCVLWLTGLSGSGKTTIAVALERKFISLGLHTYLLDGDDFRNTMSNDLKFSDVDRNENIRRAGHTAKILYDAGLIVLCCFISPQTKDRNRVRSLFKKNDFIEIFIDCPLDVCVERDAKGLYRKALNGTISNFTGITSIYEPPIEPEIIVRTNLQSVDKNVADILFQIRQLL